MCAQSLCGIMQLPGSSGVKPKVEGASDTTSATSLQPPSSSMPVLSPVGALPPAQAGTNMMDLASAQQAALAAAQYQETAQQQPPQLHMQHSSDGGNHQNDDEEDSEGDGDGDSDMGDDGDDGDDA